jgi:hypothetical protein
LGKTAGYDKQTFFECVWEPIDLFEEQYSCKPLIVYLEEEDTIENLGRRLSRQLSADLTKNNGGCH